MDEATQALRDNNLARLSKLASQGHPVDGLGDAYRTRLLEFLVGEHLDDVKRTHELWVAEQLDDIEQRARRARLGVPQHNGRVTERQ